MKPETEDEDEEVDGMKREVTTNGQECTQIKKQMEQGIEEYEKKGRSAKYRK